MLRPFVLALVILAPLSASADPHPLGLQPHPFNGSAAPVTENGVTSFTIESRECSDVPYGDGRGETDCQNGNVRSTFGWVGVPVGQAVTYEFEVRVPEPVGYDGWWNSHAMGYLTGALDSRLRIASWEGDRLHDFIFMLKLDARHGIRFLDETCVPADALGDWHHFRMEVSWRNDASGWIRVTCDDRVVHFAEGVVSAENPHCYVTNLCRQHDGRSMREVGMILGPVMQGFGPEWDRHGRASPFTDFEGSIIVEFRNVSVQRGATLYDEAARETVSALQTHLNALSCDAGPADGIMGPRTRAATLECRAFDAGVAPDTVDARSVGTWLAVYRAHHPF